MEQKSAQYSHLHLGMIPSIDRTLVFDDDLIIADNLGRVMPEGIDRAIAEGHPTEVITPGNFAFPSRLDFSFLLLCKTGHIKAGLNLNDYDVSSNCILLAQSGIILDKLEYQRGTRFAIIAFTGDSFVADLGSRSIKVLRNNLYQPIFLNVGEKYMSLFIDGYNIMRRIIEQGSFYFQKDLINGFSQIVSAGLAQLTLKNEDAIRKCGTQGRNEVIFRKFLLEVQSSCKFERQLGFYANQACMSSKYFAKIIFDVSGRHATDWIKDGVILEAKVLLKGGTHTVQQVSDALHFPNSSFFGKYFKSVVGLSPRQYVMQGKK